MIRSVVVSWYPYFLQMVLRKSPEQVALSEALRFTRYLGPAVYRGGEVTGPTKCITRASTIGSIRGRSSRYSICRCGRFWPFRGRKLQSRFPRWPPPGVNFVRFGSEADIGQPIKDVRFAPASRHERRRNRCLLCATSGHNHTDSLDSRFRRSRELAAAKSAEPRE
jgi:hypothetical protein